MSRTHSLSFVVALWTGIVIALCMGLYAVFQYNRTPGVAATELVFQHLWHVVVLAGAIYVLCGMVFRRIVAQPIRQICKDLYGIGAGRLDEIDVPTSIAELRNIADSINLMIRRMKIGVDSDALNETRRHVNAVREIGRKVSERDQVAGTLLLEHVAVLEKNVQALVQERASSEIGAPHGRR